MVSYSVKRWREEGLADYLSAVVYPKNNLELRHLGKFAQMELRTTLVDKKRAYTTSLFWQFLANRIGITGIITQIIPALPSSGGKAAQAAALGGLSGMEDLYLDFAKELSAPKSTIIRCRCLL